jgi:hypothetical protein
MLQKPNILREVKIFPLREGAGYFPHWLKLKLAFRLYYSKGGSVNKRWMMRLK